MICRRCKSVFQPKHQEARCSNCLQNRTNNRIAKRKQARDEEKQHDTIRRLMTSNGSNKKGITKIIGMLH